MGEVRSMRADIVDRGIEHGTAKFIIDGGRCACVKYDDYDHDENGSRGFSVARYKKCVCVCVCVCVCARARAIIIENIPKMLNCNNNFVLFFTYN